VSAIPSERYLFGIISELRRLNRSIALPLERDLKRAGCPPLERCEVLREIDESGDVHLSLVELQTRLAVPRDRMSRLRCLHIRAASCRLRIGGGSLDEGLCNPS
jgi:hypothetical protein